MTREGTGIPGIDRSPGEVRGWQTSACADRLWWASERVRRRDAGGGGQSRSESQGTIDACGAFKEMCLELYVLHFLTVIVTLYRTPFKC